MKKEEIERTEADKAFALFEALQNAKREVGAKFLAIGSILLQIKEEKLYKYFNCDSFKEFLAIPELGMAWQTSRLFMHVFDLYIRRLKCDTDRIANIGIGNLQTIAPVVEEDIDGWLSLAENNSRSDLINTVREHQGKELMKPAPEEKEDETDTGIYQEFVSSHACAVCNSGGVDAHHFPITKGAGGEDWKVIPLCRKCHGEYHQDPHRFIIANEVNLFDYFYEIIRKAFKVKAEG